MKSAVSVFISFNYGNTAVLIRDVLCVSADYFESDSDTIVRTHDIDVCFPSSSITFICSYNSILNEPEIDPDLHVLTDPIDIVSFSCSLWYDLKEESRPRHVEGRHKEAKDLEELTSLYVDGVFHNDDYEINEELPF